MLAPLGDKSKYGYYFRATHRARVIANRLNRLTELQKLTEVRDTMPTLLAAVRNAERLWSEYKSTIDPAVLASSPDQLAKEEVDRVSTSLAIDRAVFFLSKMSECVESSSSPELSVNQASTSFALMPLFDGNVFKFSSWLSLFEIRVMPLCTDNLDIVLKLLQHLEDVVLVRLTHVIQDPSAYSYDDVKALLTDMYQDPAIMLKELMNDVHAVAHIETTTQANEVAELLLTIQTLLEDHHYDEHFNHNLLCEQVISKFNNPLVVRSWRQVQEACKEVNQRTPKIQELLSFICCNVEFIRPYRYWRPCPRLPDSLLTQPDGACAMIPADVSTLQNGQESTPPPSVL